MDTTRRKVIRQGHNTLTVTLPAEWVKRLNIEQGTELDMSEMNNGIFLSTEKKSMVKKAEFNITGMDVPTIWKHFTAVYRGGYDEVLIRFNPNEFVEPLEKHVMQHKRGVKNSGINKKTSAAEAVNIFISRFIGMEIFEHGKDFVRVKQMGEISGKEFDNSLRRMFLLIQQMAEETCNVIKQDDPNFLNSMHDIDFILDKFHDYCVRILNRLSNKDPQRASALFAIMHTIELAGDEFRNISHHLVRKDKNQKYSKGVEILSELVKGRIEAFQNLFYKYNNESLNELARIDREVYINIEKYHEKTNDEEKEILHHLRMIDRYYNSLVELRVQMEY